MFGCFWFLKPTPPQYNKWARSCEIILANLANTLLHNHVTPNFLCKFIFLTFNFFFSVMFYVSASSKNIAFLFFFIPMLSGGKAVCSVCGDFRCPCTYFCTCVWLHQNLTAILWMFGFLLGNVTVTCLTHDFTVQGNALVQLTVNLISSN